MRLRDHLGCFSCLLAVAVCVSCGYAGVPRPPSLNLPASVNDLRAIRKGNSVYLAWSVPTLTTDQLPVRHLGDTKICRNLGFSVTECATSVGVVPPAKPEPKQIHPQASYVDKLPGQLISASSSLPIAFAVVVSNANGRDAGVSNSVLVSALPAPLPPSDFQAQATAEGITLHWAAASILDTSSTRHIYRVYRREEGKDADTVAGEADANATGIVDHSFEWEKTYLYRVTVVTVLGEGRRSTEFEGDDSPMVKLFAHDVFPPAVPASLQAVFSGAGQQPFIDLIWAPDTDADLAGYNVYRREEGGSLGKVNSELVKSPAFRDSSVAAGHTYVYSVSAVDLRGNESAKSEETTERVP